MTTKEAPALTVFENVAWTDLVPGAFFLAACVAGAFLCARLLGPLVAKADVYKRQVSCFYCVLFGSDLSSRNRNFTAHFGETAKGLPAVFVKITGVIHRFSAFFSASTRSVFSHATPRSSRPIWP